MNVLAHRNFKELIQEQLDSFVLEEGLISSYDVGKLYREIRKAIPHKIGDVSADSPGEDLIRTKYGRVHTLDISLTAPLTPSEKDKINQILKVYGYTSSAWTDDMILQLEPRYPVQMNAVLDSNGVTTLYHVTQRKYLPKIQEIGLTPRDSETTYNHPGDRIYLLWLDESKMPKDYSTEKILRSLRQTLARSKGVTPSDMAVLEIQYNPKNPYYIDDTITRRESGITGLFTTKNIPPTDITPQ